MTNNQRFFFHDQIIEIFWVTPHKEILEHGIYIVFLENGRCFLHNFLGFLQIGESFWTEMVSQRARFNHFNEGDEDNEDVDPEEEDDEENYDNQMRMMQRE